MKRWSAFGAGVVVVSAGAVVVALASERATAPAGPVGAFPVPGTKTASPQTQITLRGVGAPQVGTIEVVGSRSGAHTGRLRAHPDGQGASFLLDRPLRGGEQVTVRTGLDIVGGRNGDYRFATVSRPRAGLQSGGARPPADLLRQLTGQRGRPPSGAVTRYRSRPDLRPPEVEVQRAARATAPGLIFVSPKKVFGARPRRGLQSGPLIVDERGEPVWFTPLDRGNVTDFRVQQYQGRPVLTWWQGRQVLGTGEGVVQIADTSYRPVERVRGGNGYQLDFHESTITPQGTLLGLVYNPVARDLRSVGGPRNGRVVDAIVQEIDIATGLVLLEWHSLGNVPLRASHDPVPKAPGSLYDYFHVNSVGLANDGNLLVSGRETWSVLKIDRKTGRILSRLGGKDSDYRMAGAAQFAYQHDARQQSDGTLTIFDNEAAPRVRDRSRALVLSLDDRRRTATVKSAFGHPTHLLAGTQGNVQRLADGHMFVGWGSQGYFTEFGPAGDVLFDARLARGSDTYRAYRLPWQATPPNRPAVAATDGGRTVYASFNGATDVATWEVLAGSSPDALTLVASGRRDGFETRLRTPAPARYVAVRAKDASGAVLGSSPAIRPGR
jgi:hypothetical protein